MGTEVRVAQRYNRKFLNALHVANRLHRIYPHPGTCG